MNDWTEEELKTYLGGISTDLRGDWSCNYQGRISSLIEALELLLDKREAPDDELMRDILVAEEEYENPYDGRVFRDSFSLYGYSSDEGFTLRVYSQLKCDCNYPEKT